MPAPKSNTFDAVLWVLNFLSQNKPNKNSAIWCLENFLDLSPATQRKVMFSLTSAPPSAQDIATRHKAAKGLYSDTFKRAPKLMRKQAISGDFEEARTAFAIAEQLNTHLKEDSSAALYDVMNAFNGLCHEKKQSIWEKLKNKETGREGYIDLLFASGLIYKAQITFPA
ncbi:MAG: hypothetical protein OSB62_06535 [Alphaproteobacteria bacterium]|nr:hypothetical protein [Alphaproteobacteria bacterium]